MPSKKDKKAPHSARNRLLAHGIVTRFSRSAIFRKSGAWAIKSKKYTAPKKDGAKTVTKQFGKTTRTVIRPRAPRTYPTEDVARPLRNIRPDSTPVTLKKNITPGTVLIILAGRFRGRRVVFLKQLASGLLLVTGPYKVNGVPLRRINQTLTIATSTKINLGGIKIDEKFNDNYFKRPVAAKKQKTEQEFFAAKTEKKQIDKSRAEDQKAFDKPILDAVTMTPVLKDYLGARFSLKRGQFPHELKF